jgi:hypothetical protein
MAKRPSFQFYPADWIKDPALRRCTKAEKGVWIDMLCLMHECEDYGVLASADVPWSDHEIAGAIGGDISENLACISELLRKGVATRNHLGAIFSKRMARDENKRNLCSIAGKKGGNPTLKTSKNVPKRQPKSRSSPDVEPPDKTLKGHSKGGVKGESKGRSKPKLTPSSSSSEEDIKNISSSPPYIPPGGGIAGEELMIDLPPWLAEQDWLAFLQHRREMKEPMSVLAQQRAIRQLAKLKNEGCDVASVIDQSIVNRWKGLFPVRDNFQKGLQDAKRKESISEMHWRLNTQEFRGSANGKSPANLFLDAEDQGGFHNSSGNVFEEVDISD